MYHVGQVAGWSCLALLAVTSALGVGSQTGPQRDVPGEAPAVHAVDVPEFSTMDLPKWESQSLYSIGLDRDAFGLHRIAGAVFLLDGTLVIADTGASTLVFADQEGVVRSRVGREGEGPGDYLELQRVGVTVDGRVFAYDARQERLTFLDASGVVSEVLSVNLHAGYSPELPLVSLADGGFLAIYEPRADVSSGLQRGSLELVLMNSAGHGERTLARWKGKQFYVTAGDLSRLPVGFAETTLYAGRGQYAVLGGTDSFEITLYDGPLPILTLRGKYARTPVPAEERAAWTDAYLEGLPMPAAYRTKWKERLAVSTINEIYPAFGALAVDATGRIWIGEYASLEQERREWTIFEPDGRAIGSIELPTYRPVPLELENTIHGYPTHEILDVTTDRLALLRTDQIGDQYVEVLSIGQR